VKENGSLRQINSELSQALQEERLVHERQKNMLIVTQKELTNKLDSIE